MDTRGFFFFSSSRFSRGRCVVDPFPPFGFLLCIRCTYHPLIRSLRSVFYYASVEKKRNTCIFFSGKNVNMI